MNDTRVHLEIPAGLRFLSLLSACIAELLARESSIAERDTISYNLQLAVQEIATNIVEHAYAASGGRISVELRICHGPHRIELVLIDQGRPFQAEHWAAPQLDTPQEGGYGLFLARELLDNLEYQRVGAQNRWHLTMHL